MQLEHARTFLTDMGAVLREGAVTSELLEQAAIRLAELAKGCRQWQRKLPAATRGEALCYELGVAPTSGIALYLVSDGPGSISLPHGHQTWAVIAGGSGVERNRLYKRVPSTLKLVAQTGDVCIGAGDTLVLPLDSVHSTEAIGTEPTYHLHMYGMSLTALQPIGARTFEIAHDV